MRDVALRRIEPAKNMARFYAIGIQPTLFGDLAVVRRWGRIGTHGRTRETWFSDPSPALAFAGRLESVKRRRGYREGRMLIGYARVSTQDQTPALQLDALKAAGCERIFVEKASGAQRDRPELNAALDYVREDVGDVLVVWKLDRLARSLSQLIDTADLLQKRGIGLRSLTEAIDTTSAGGRLVFHVFGAMAEFERSIIRERTKAGLDAARARGRTGGRPPCPIREGHCSR